MFIRAFSKINERVLWKYSDSADEGSLITHNILRVQWLPQNELLSKKTTVFIILFARDSKIMSK